MQPVPHNFSLHDQRPTNTISQLAPSYKMYSKYLKSYIFLISTLLLYNTYNNQHQNPGKSNLGTFSFNLSPVYFAPTVDQSTDRCYSLIKPFSEPPWLRHTVILQYSTLNPTLWSDFLAMKHHTFKKTSAKVIDLQCNPNLGVKLRTLCSTALTTLESCRDKLRLSATRCKHSHVNRWA